MDSTYEAANYYVDTLGWYLVPIPSGQKGPNGFGWNDPSNTIHTIEAIEYFKTHPDNMGVLLAPSNIVTFDIDNVEETKIILGNLGLDYDTILAGAPRIKGREGHDKAIFLAPADTTLTTRKLSWEDKDDGAKTHAVFELRGGLVQDVLPPSIHPDTQRPYEWLVEPSGEIPRLPEQLLTIWKEWDKFRPQLQNMCPWARIVSKPPSHKKITCGWYGEDIIQKFNDANRVTDIIERHGYKRITNNRYLSPYSKTGLAGVHVFPTSNAIFSHHASEPFDTAGSHDAFDMFCFFECGRSVSVAIETAAKQLGIVTPAEHGKTVGGTLMADDEKDALITKAFVSQQLPPLPALTHPFFCKWMGVGGRIMYSHKPYHIGNLLPIASTALGRRVGVQIATKYITTNVFVMIAGVSTISGKSFSTDTAMEEFGSHVASIPTLLNPIDATLSFVKTQSNPAFIQEMSRSWSALWYYDEAQEFFAECCGGDGGKPWNAPMIQTLCTAYDGGKLERRLSSKVKGGEEQVWTCEKPFVNLLFNMTLNQLRDATNSRTLSSGFFFRWLWFVETGGERRKNTPISDDDTQSVKDIRAELLRVGTLLKQLEPGAIVFNVNDTIEQWAMDASTKSIDENYQAAIGRLSVQIYKIAMIFAMFDPEFQATVFDQPSYPIKRDIPQRWVDEAILLGEYYLLPRMLMVAEYANRVDKNNKQQLVVSALLSFGGCADRSSLLRKTRLDKLEFDKAINTLLESKDIIPPFLDKGHTIYCISNTD